MNHLKAVHRVLRACLMPIAGALALLSIAACGIFSSDATPVPQSAAIPTSQPATAVIQSSTSESVDKTAAEDSGLSRAVWTGDVETVKNLVAAGADANENDEDGNPYLHEAIWRGHLEVVQVLIDAGADVNAKDADGNPLLHEAIWRGHTEVARVLVDAGADVDAKDSDGNPLLYSAIWRDHHEITEILADAGANVDARDSDGRPAPVHRGLAGENGGSEDSHRCRRRRQRKKAQRGIAPVRGAMAGPYGNRADSPGSGGSGMNTVLAEVLRCESIEA